MCVCVCVVCVACVNVCVCVCVLRVLRVCVCVCCVCCVCVACVPCAWVCCLCVMVCLVCVCVCVSVIRSENLRNSTCPMPDEICHPQSKTEKRIVLEVLHPYARYEKSKLRGPPIEKKLFWPRAKLHLGPEPNCIWAQSPISFGSRFQCHSCLGVDHIWAWARCKLGSQSDHIWVRGLISFGCRT